MAVAVLRKASEDSTEPYQTIIDRRNERIIDTAGRLECCAYLSLSTFKSNRATYKDWKQIQIYENECVSTNSTQNTW